MKIRKILALLCAAVIGMLSLTACGDDEEVPESEYAGVLTKIRLGMPQSKVLALNNQNEVYYESDSEIWCINADTDIMEMKDLIPSDSQYYYCDDSVITYRFDFDEAKNDYLLEGYTEEAVCLIDRETAKKYYETKLKELAAKYGVSDYVTTQKGTENVDMVLELETAMNLSSFTVTATMTYTYDTVDGVDGYYCTHFKIDIEELANKAAVAVGGVTEAAAAEE
ncbi:MAG: hypothetical protein ACI4XF_02580 [Oscillospiraceae bacterium]